MHIMALRIERLAVLQPRNLEDINIAKGEVIPEVQVGGEAAPVEQVPQKQLKGTPRRRVMVDVQIVVEPRDNRIVGELRAQAGTPTVIELIAQLESDAVRPLAFNGEGVLVKRDGVVIPKIAREAAARFQEQGFPRTWCLCRRSRRRDQQGDREQQQQQDRPVHHASKRRGIRQYPNWEHRISGGLVDTVRCVSGSFS